jgi:hypothetical protein
MASPHVSFAAQSYPGSEAYLEALHALLSPKLTDWSLGIEIDIPPFATWGRLLRTAAKCEDLGIPFYLDDLCMMGDLIRYERSWPSPSQLSELLEHCPRSFRGARLHTLSRTHEVTPNHYVDFLRWNAKHLREVQLVVAAATWPGSDWQRTTTVRPEQPWTVLAHFHATAADTASTKPVRRVPRNGSLGYSIHLDHPQPCNAATLRRCLMACLPHNPSCLALRPLHWLVDNPGSAKLPPDLHSWPLFNMVDALRPHGKLVLTESGEALVGILGTG